MYVYVHIYDFKFTKRIGLLFAFSFWDRMTVFDILPVLTYLTYELVYLFLNEVFLGTHILFYSRTSSKLMKF